MADQVFLVNSSSFQDVEISASLRAVDNAIVDFSRASTVTGSFSGPAQGLTGVSASYIIPTANTTASISNTASYLNPGATLYVVSSSTNPSYIEPYNIPIDPYTPPFKEGRMFYDSDFHNWVYYPDLNFKLHIGKEVIWRVHNPYNTTLAATTAVYISGSTSGGLPDAYKAIADGTGTKSDVVGIIRSDITSGSFGYIMCNGVIHDVNVGSFQIGDEIWLSPTVEGGFVNAAPGQPYESIRIGSCQETGVEGSIALNIYTQPPPANAYAGMTSVPSITDNTGSSEVYIGSGSVNLYDNIAGEGAIVQYPVLPMTFSVVAGFDASFVYATSNGVTASYEITSNFNDINGTTKALVTTLYRADEDAHWMESQAEGLALANKLNTRLLETEKFRWESGFTLISTGSNYFTITEGAIWFGATNISQQLFNSFDTGSVNPMYETHWAYHSASSWVIPTQPDGKWNSGYYDDGTNLVALGPNSWSCHYVYRILGENPFDEDTFLVTSNYQYDSFGSSQADTLPAGVPAVLDDVALMVGRLIFQSGSTSATPETAFTTNFGQSTITQHNSLGGLQGGTGGQYYHMDLTDYTGTGTGLMVRQTNPQMSGITGSITSASFASFATTAGFALTSNATQLFTGSTYQITSSWAEKAITSSYSPVDPIYSASAAAFISTKENTLITGNTYTITSSWAENAPQQQNISVNSITASFISASNIRTIDPTSTYDVATKAYVDNLSQQSLDFYFRSASSDLPDYYQMRRLSIPLSSSLSTFTVNAVSASQYFLNYASADIGTVGISQGRINIRFHMWYNTGGGRTISVSPEIYLSSSTGINELAFAVETALDGNTTAQYLATLTLTSSVDTSPTDRLVCKFKATSVSGTPNVTFEVEGDTSAGVFVPVPSSNFVLRAGDTMTGTLNGTLFNGPLTGSSFGTSSWSENATSASWAPTGTSGTTLYTGSTYSITASWAENATSASWAPGGQSSGTTLYTGSTYQITSSWSEKAVSASWAPTGTSGTTLFTGSTYQITASWAEKAVSASWAPTGTSGTTLFTGSTYQITASWAITASNAISASWAPLTITNTFSRGGTFYDAFGIAGPTARSQSVYIWRAPFDCTATAIYGIMVANAGLTASVTAEHNNSVMLTTPINITASNVWVPYIIGTLISQSFVAGDRLEITFLTASTLGVTQSAIQIDFTRP